MKPACTQECWHASWSPFFHAGSGYFSSWFNFLVNHCHICCACSALWIGCMILCATNIRLMLYNWTEVTFYSILISCCFCLLPSVKLAESVPLSYVPFLTHSLSLDALYITNNFTVYSGAPCCVTNFWEVSPLFFNFHSKLLSLMCMPLCVASTFLPSFLSVRYCYSWMYFHITIHSIVDETHTKVFESVQFVSSFVFILLFFVSFKYNLGNFNKANCYKWASLL